MGLQDLAWIAAAITMALSIYNFVSGIGHHKGATDAQVSHFQDNEKAWNAKFDALHNLVTVHYQQANEQLATQRAETASRFERVLERLNEALLTMAREHPTKTDLQHMKEEILDRIDGRTTPRRKSLTKDI
jgi:dipeptidase